MQFKGKLTKKTWKSCKKPNSSSILASLAQIWAPNFFLWVLPLLDVRHCISLSSYSISRNTYDPNSRKWRKTSFWAWFRFIGPKFGPPFLFFENLFRQSLDIMVSYHHVKYQKKLMIQSWQTVVQTEEQTDGREWFQRTLSNWSRASKSIEKR